MAKDYIGEAKQMGLFYRDNYRKLIKFAFLLGLVILGLLGYSYHLFLQIPEQSFFATTTSGRVIQLQPSQ